MNIRPIAPLLVGAAALLAAPAVAQDSSSITSRTDLSATLEGNFKRIDKDGDGAVTSAEVTAAQQAMIAEANAALEKRFAAEFKKLDSNGDGQLSLAEFTASAPEARPKSQADSQLQKFDANKDGKITLAEFRDPVLANFDKVDSNKDGKLSDSEQQKALAARGR